MILGSVPYLAEGKVFPLLLWGLHGSVFTCLRFPCSRLRVALKKKVNISWQADSELFAINLGQLQTVGEQ